ncbi:MAG: AMP-binding protein [Cyanobacteria bacterium P01_F01_bin.86]
MTYLANSQPIKDQSESDMTTLLARLQWRAVHQSNRIAYRFLADQPLSVAESDLTTWTYSELYERVQIIAGALSKRDGVVGQPVLLVYPPGLELIAAFLGCLSAGAIATLVPPPRRHESLARWQHIMADANVAGVLTTQALLSTIEPLMVRSPKHTAASSLYWLTTDMIEGSHTGGTEGVDDIADVDNNRSCSKLPTHEKDVLESIAFLQYTSGSTSRPKGVIVTHANIAHNLQQIQESFGHSANTECVIWLPPYHDMGLIGGILQPLYGGYPVTLMSPTSFLRRPSRWLEAISHFGGTTSGGPNFAYDYCVQKISPEQCQPLDLSSWSVAFTGAEPVQAKTLTLFSEKFSSCGFSKNAFYPCYGLAESTLFVTGGEATASPKVISISQAALKQGKVQHMPEPVEQAVEQAIEQAIEQAVGPGVKQSAGPESAPVPVPEPIQVVSCGQAATQQIEIVDPQTKLPCAPHQVGEIWVAGDSVAAGYWGRVKATQETFDNVLEEQERPFLRTGDLGFLFSGELFVTGRLKDLIVIRGQNYYPQDIELSIKQAHTSLQPAAAVFSLSPEEAQSSQEQLVIVQELSRTAVRQIRKKTLAVSAIVEAIKACVSQQHGLQVWAVVLLKPGALPKTTSGKVKRQACKAAFKDRTLDSVHQWPKLWPQKRPGKQPEEQPDKQPEKRSERPTQRTNAQGQADKKTEQLLRWLQGYARDSINSRLMDERRCLSPGIILDFGNKGLLGMQVPHKYGGLALNNQSMLRVVEQLGAIDTTLALFVGLNNVLGIRPILNHAPNALKEQLLPQLATGRELAAFALTETGAGSHPFGICSKATPMANGWQLQGEKIWSGSAAWAGVTTIFAQQVDEAGKPIGISAFAVKKGTPGLRQGPEALTMGMRGMVQNTVLLENVPVGDKQRLGEAGKGMLVAQDAMMYGRLAIAAACVGGMKRCAQLMLRYSQRRTISTGKLLDNPVMQTRLNWVVNAIAATESLVTLTATRLDRGLHVPEELYAACKIAGPEFYWQAADHLMQCLGGRGYIETNLAPQILRDARVLRIFEGPTESLAMYLGSRIVNQPESLRDLFDNLALSEISGLLFEASDWVLAHYLSEKSPFPESPTARRQAHFIIGKIATWAILLAALKANSAPKSAIEWSQGTFEKAVKQALQTQPDESLDISATLKNIEQYQHDIGDIEQTLAGTDESIDSWLKAELKETRKVFPGKANASKVDSGVTVSNQPEEQAEEQAEKLSSHTIEAALQNAKISRASSETRDQHQAFATKRARAIELWMVQWLSERLEISANTIDPNKAFADYGLDSVMAVELAQDLGIFFNIAEPLEATLAWNFPTIQGLANHLAIMLSQQEINGAETTTKGQKASRYAEESHALSTLSEAEVADALAAELATVRGL